MVRLCELHPQPLDSQLLGGRAQGSCRKSLIDRDLGKEAFYAKLLLSIS